MSIIKNCNYKTIIDDIKKINTDSILLIVDRNLWDVYKEHLNLENNLDKKVIVWKSFEGENTKTFQEYERCLEFFIEKGVHRNSHLIAFGGGATSDFAGFIAATLLRGMPWSIIPTTLLSMVDASIGGKVAINSKNAKNLVGSFHLPQFIWQNFDVLRTLPQQQLISGKGEIIKYAFLDEDIFKLIHKNPENLIQIISACALYKKKITEEDLEENGDRKLLNLGHTFGHAIEKIYDIEHGIAVIWGLGLILKLFCNDNFINELITLKNKLEIKMEYSPWLNKDFPTGKIMNLICKDKKMLENSAIDLILIDNIGKPRIEKKKISEIQKLMDIKNYELKKFTF